MRWFYEFLALAAAAATGLLVWELWPTNVPTGAAFVGVMTVAGVLIGLGFNYWLERRRQRRTTHDRTIAAAIAAADSLAGFQQSCVDRGWLACSRPVHLPANPTQEARLATLTAPHVTLRDEPTLLADLPETERAAVLDLVDAAREHNSRVAALDDGLSDPDRTMTILPAKVRFETGGLARLALDADAIQRDLATLTGRRPAEKLQDAAAKLRGEAAAARADLVRAAAYGALERIVRHANATADGRNKPETETAFNDLAAFEPWLRRVWRPVLGTRVTDALNEVRRWALNDNNRKFRSDVVGHHLPTRGPPPSDADVDTVTSTTLEDLRGRLRDTPAPDGLSKDGQRVLHEIRDGAERALAQDPRPIPEFWPPDAAPAS